MTGRGEQTARWMYRGIWSVLVGWFRVPDQPPTLPTKPGEFIQSFQPAPGFLKYLKLIFWIVAIAIDIGLTAAYLAAAVPLILGGLWWVALLLLPIALVLIIAPDVIAYIAIHLRYDTTWYVITDRSLRIRRGIWAIHETTITFENVQNLKMQQGPLQRHYGIANLIVETAGSGGEQSQKSNMGVSNRGIIEGIDNAQEFRERILARMRQTKSAGLGDDADEVDAGRLRSTWSSEHISALREIRDEVRSLTLARNS